MQRSTLDRSLLLRNRSAVLSLILAVFLGIVLSALVVTQALLLAGLLGDLVRHHPIGRNALDAFIAVTALRFVVASVGDYLSTRSAVHTVATLRHDLLLVHQADRSRKNTKPQHGQLVMEATRGLRQLEVFYARYIPATVVAALAPLLALIVLGIKDWPSLLIALGLLAILPFPMISFGRRARTKSETQWRRLGVLAARIQSIIRATPSLKALGDLESARGELESISTATANSIVATLRVAFLSSAGLEFLSGVGVGLVAMLAGFRLVSGSLSLGSAFAVVLVTPEVFMPLRRAGAAFHEASEGRSAGLAALEMLDQTQVPKPGQQRPPTLALSLTGLWVSGMAHPVSLELGQGDRVVIRGSSGSGKSSLLHLIAGLIEPEQGGCQVGGFAMDSLDRVWWREHLGYVPQRPHLFSGSLRDNVLLGSSMADDKLGELLESLGLSRLMVRGLDTRLGESTSGVSGGELQRLALARCLIRPRDWFLLDEAGSHLDEHHRQMVRSVIAQQPDSVGIIEVAQGPSVLPDGSSEFSLSALTRQP